MFELVGPNNHNNEPYKYPQIKNSIIKIKNNNTDVINTIGNININNFTTNKIHFKEFFCQCIRGCSIHGLHRGQ